MASTNELGHLTNVQTKNFQNSPLPLLIIPIIMIDLTKAVRYENLMRICLACGLL